MSPNISSWCTANDGILTVSVLEGKLAERTCSLPCGTGLLTAPPEGKSVALVKEGWECFPGLPLPKQADPALGRLMLLGSRQSRLVSAPSVSGTVLGARDVDVSKTGSLSHMDQPSTMQDTP